MKIFTGVGYYFKGISFWFQHRCLWKYAVIPWIVTIALAILGLPLLLLLIYYLTQWLSQFRFFAKMSQDDFYRLVFLMALLPTLLLFLFVQNLFTGAFLQKLSWKVEEIIAGRTIINKAPGFWRGFLDRFKACKDWLAIGAIFLVINIVPAIGQIAGLGYLCYQIGAGYLDYVYQRRHLPYDKQKHKNRRHRWEIIGMGLMCFLAVLIPVPLIDTVCRLNSKKAGDAAHQSPKHVGLFIFTIAFILLVVPLVNVLGLCYNVIAGTLLAVEKTDRRKIMGKAKKVPGSHRDGRRPKKKQPLRRRD